MRQLSFLKFSDSYPTAPFTGFCVNQLHKSIAGLGKINNSRHDGVTLFCQDRLSFNKHIQAYTVIVDANLKLTLDGPWAYEPPSANLASGEILRDDHSSASTAAPSDDVRRALHRGERSGGLESRSHTKRGKLPTRRHRYNVRMDVDDICESQRQWYVSCHAFPEHEPY